tara:strand:- start:128 stop:388 length:261 start_codon:yes stop_codon:yes gene_type:complete
VLLAYFDRIKVATSSGNLAEIEAAKARRPWIRITVVVSEDGEMAFCIEDNGTGIKHERLDSALRPKARLSCAAYALMLARPRVPPL